LGPGLLKSVYEIVLAYELQQRGLRVDHQVPIAIRHKDMVFDAAFRADLVVGKGASGNKVSGTDQRSPQEAGANHLRLRGYKLGFLLNCGEALMKRGILLVVNGLEDN